LKVTLKSMMSNAGVSSYYGDDDDHIIIIIVVVFVVVVVVVREVRDCLTVDQVEALAWVA